MWGPERTAPLLLAACLAAAACVGEGRPALADKAAEPPAADTQASVQGPPAAASAPAHDGPRVVSVATAATYTCAVVEDGRGYCWGGLDGEGDPTPTPIPGDRRFRVITAAGMHTCALDADGAAYCRGVNRFGQLGTGDTTSAWPEPVPVAGDFRFAEIDAGGLATCGLDAGGVAFCWGSYVPPVPGGPAPVLRPTPVPGGLRFTSLSVGSGNVCGVTTEGALYCWGAGRGGEQPARIGAPERFVSVSAGDGVACAVGVDGKARCWGRNELGQLGRGVDGGAHEEPAPVAGEIRFATVDAGSVHACGVARDSRAYCWGSNQPPMLGTRQPTGVCDRGGPGERDCSPVPVPVEVDEPFEAVSVGEHHACGIARSGRLFCWGANTYGELGTGWDDEATPAEVSLTR